MDYVHINPLKHGLARRVRNWPHSTFHRLVEEGIYTADWAGGDEDLLGYENQHTAQCPLVIAPYDIAPYAGWWCKLATRGC
jgi:hypothetical protein